MIIKVWCQFLLFQLSVFPLAAQIEFSGFFRSQISAYSENDPSISHLNKARGRLDTEHTVLELDMYSFHGIAEQISENLIEIQLNQAYANVEIKNAELTIGKQVILWGNGLFWNPTDILNSLPLYDPVLDFPGVNALRVEIPTADFSYFWGAAVPETKFSKSRFLLRNVVNFEETDFGTAISYRGLDEQTVISADIKGQMFGAGAWFEAARFSKKNNSHLTLLLGSDYTINLGKGIYTGFEYFHDESGKTSEQYDFSQLLEGTSRTLAKDYLIFILSTQLSMRTSLNFNSLVNLTDGGAVLSPAWRYTLFPDTDILIGGYFVMAEKGDEFHPDFSEYSTQMPQELIDITGKSQVYLWIEVNF